MQDFVVVLNSDEAVRAFSMGGNVTLGGTISAAAGPIGTGGSVQSALASPAAVFSYSRSKGLYAGLSLEGTVLIERKEANKAFYGSAVPAKSILTGLVPAPEIASPLYEVRSPHSFSIEKTPNSDSLARAHRSSKRPRASTSRPSPPRPGSRRPKAAMSRSTRASRHRSPATAVES